MKERVKVLVATVTGMAKTIDIVPSECIVKTTSIDTAVDEVLKLDKAGYNVKVEFEEKIITSRCS